MTSRMFACKEPDGIRLRRVAAVEPTPRNVSQMYSKLKAWNPQLSPATIEEFYRQDKRYWVVDDVGLMWATYHENVPVEGHFVFWDRRLRGREMLVRRMAETAMELSNSKSLWCVIPTRLRILRAFLLRTGFVEKVLDGGWSLMVIQHSGWRP